MSPTIDTSMPDLIQQLLAALVSKSHTPIPIEYDVWDIETIARYLKKSAQVVRERIACQESFPKAIRIPTKGSNGGAAKGQPLYNAKEVIQWVQKYKEKH